MDTGANADIFRKNGVAETDLQTAEKGLNEPRYPKLPMIMKAKKKTLDKKDDAGTVIRTNVKQIKAELPPTKGAGKKLEGSIDDIVGQLVDGLQNKDKMI